MFINIVTKGHFIVWLFVELPKFHPSHARFHDYAKAIIDKLIIQGV